MLRTAFQRRVDALAAAILMEEGPHHVAGRYVADEHDATTARQIEADRRARVEHAAELRRELLASRWELTEAGAAVLAQAARNRELRNVVASLVDDRACAIDRHGVCVTHDEPCTHERGRFECPVAVGRQVLARSRRAAS